MPNYRKNKIKVSLIDDFIQISLISNFCCSIERLNLNQHQTLLKENSNLVYILNKRYMELIEQLKLNDNSFKVLVNDLNKNNNLFEKEKQANFCHIEKTLKETKKVLTRIYAELDSKLKLLI